MEEYLTDGDGGYSIQINSLIQATTKQAYHISGGQITPGTDANNVTVAVDNGEVSVGGQVSSFAAKELTLEDGGVGPSGSDLNTPRVDVISAQQNGTLAVTTGKPEPYAPDTDESGNPITPAPFEHWSPSPDSGSRVPGCVLGFVLVEAGATRSNDIVADEIRQWKIPGGIQAGAYVLGNGADNGTTTIDVTDNTYTVRDSSDTIPGYIKRAYGQPDTPLFLGTPDAPATLRSSLHTNEKNITYGSSDSNLKLIDEGSGVSTNERAAIELSQSRLFVRRNLNLKGHPMRNVDGITFSSPAPALDFKPVSAAIGIWESNHSTTGETIKATTDPDRDVAFRLLKNGNSLAKVSTSGAVELNQSTLSKVSSITFSRSGLSDTGQVRVRDDGTLMWVYGGTGYEIAGPGAP